MGNDDSLPGILLTAYFVEVYVVARVPGACGKPVEPNGGNEKIDNELPTVVYVE